MRMTDIDTGIIQPPPTLPIIFIISSFLLFQTRSIPHQENIIILNYNCWYNVHDNLLRMTLVWVADMYYLILGCDICGDEGHGTDRCPEIQPINEPSASLLLPPLSL